jgi:hypothetical protein
MATAHPVDYTTVDAAAIAFGEMKKDGVRYSVPFLAPLFIKTPPLEVATHLAIGDDALPYATLKVPEGLVAFFRGIESAVLRTCQERKSEWFRNEPDDDELVAGFRSFVVAPDSVKVRVDGEVFTAFDESKLPVPAADVGPGTRGRAVLRLQGISFGRTEFGALWTLVQFRKDGVPRCLIDDEDDVDDADGCGDDELLEDEFM